MVALNFGNATRASRPLQELPSRFIFLLRRCYELALGRLRPGRHGCHEQCMVTETKKPRLDNGGSLRETADRSQLSVLVPALVSERLALIGKGAWRADQSPLSHLSMTKMTGTHPAQTRVFTRRSCRRGCEMRVGRSCRRRLTGAWTG